MSQITEVYQSCELLLDALGSELHALQRDAAAGHYVDGARRFIVEGLEMDLQRVLHQIDTLDCYDQSIEGINLADPVWTGSDPEPVADDGADAGHQSGG